MGSQITSHLSFWLWKQYFSWPLHGHLSQLTYHSYIDVKRMRSVRNEVPFLPTTLARQSYQGKQTEFLSPFFMANTTLCPVSILRTYPDKTRLLHGKETKFFCLSSDLTKQWHQARLHSDIEHHLMWRRWSQSHQLSTPTLPVEEEELIKGQTNARLYTDGWTKSYESSY